MNESTLEFRILSSDRNSNSDQLGFISWIVAAISAATVAGLLYCGNLVFDGVFQKLRFFEFTRNLASKSTLEEVTNIPRFAQIVKPHKTVIDQLAIVDRLVSESKFNRAMTNTKDFAQLPIPSARNLVAELRAATGVEEQAVEIDNQLLACEQQELLLKQKYREITQNLARLLDIDVSIKSLEIERTEQGLQLPLYQTGVLANLPVIKGLPDNIESMEQLLTHLSEQRRKDMPIELARRKTTLAKELARSREESDKLVVALAELIKKQATAEDYRSAMLLTTKTHRDGIARHIRNTTIELLTPTFEPKQAFVMGKFCDYLGGICSPGAKS